MKKLPFIILLMTTVLLVSFFSCSTWRVWQGEEVKTGKDVEKGEAMHEPLSSMITEVVTSAGDPKYIYFKLGTKQKRTAYYANRTWYKNGIIGFIYNDTSLKEKAGKFKIIAISPKMSRGEIIDLNYTIKEGAVVVIEIDPRIQNKLR
ncbi:MAG: hypothetical protein GY754_25185 [bacterium]|nr:hypothetical protein [bacterium]